MSECPWKYLHFVVETDIYSDIYLCRDKLLARNALHFVAFFDFLEQIAQICFFLCRWNKCPNVLYLYYILWYDFRVLEQKLIDAFCSKKKGFFQIFSYCSQRTLLCSSKITAWCTLIGFDPKLLSPQTGLSKIQLGLRIWRIQPLEFSMWEDWLSKKMSKC